MFKQLSERIVKENVPGFINIDSFGFYEVMVNVFLEKDSLEVFLQTWLGGVLETEQSESTFIKQPSNVLAPILHESRRKFPFNLI